MVNVDIFKLLCITYEELSIKYYFYLQIKIKKKSNILNKYFFTLFYHVNCK